MRRLEGWQRWAVGGWLVAAALFQLYTAATGIMQPRVQRGIHLFFLLPVAFLLYPATKKSPKDRFTALDILLAVLSAIPPIYLIVANEALNMRFEFVDPVTSFELFLGILNILMLLEAIRRAVVPAMAILVGAFVVYLYVAPHLPSIFYGKPMVLSRIVEMQYLITDAGIYGAITGVSATFVALFVILGAFLETTKMGEFFTKVASRVAGTSPGGPAQIAVISSGLFGSISGVGAANVYATGTFTIPMMKRIGYRPQFAGAVEAVASTGGLIMPPVMGAGAFVMSELTGISYIKICAAALLGAIFYYMTLSLTVRFVALRHNLKGIPPEEVPSWKEIVRDVYLLLPAIGLVYLLVKGYSPFMAAFYAILLALGVSFFRKETMMTPKKLLSALELGGRNMIMIAIACAGAGMVVSIVTHTGLGLGIASVITSWSGGMLFPALLLIMATSIILGMGLPCTPAYIIAITIGGPALLAMGVDVLSAHLFVFYFAILAEVTPPVCIVAYCGAAIAGSDPMKTGFEAAKLAIVGFIVPYIFMYNKALLLKGSLWEILTLIILLGAACALLASGIAGYFFKKLGPFRRALVFVTAGILIAFLVNPGAPAEIAAIGVVFSLVLYAILRHFAIKKAAGSHASQNTAEN
ncbi:MAG TPA: TRAP transporter fused permease subunit [Synergistaceae bacterium]|nr:TRAP transporter fused permease subunit [Synergistaceae bacterium]